MRSLKFGINHRVLLIGAIGVLGLLTAGGIMLAGVRTQGRLQAAADETAITATLTGSTVTNMLLARRAEKDFLLRSDEDYVVKQADAVAKVRTQLQTLESRLGALGNPDLIAKAKELASGFTAYAANFQALAEARRKLGLNADAGLEGTLRASVHDIENLLKAHDEPRLAAAMLTMRRHEKDFMLRRDARYGAEMQKAAAAFTELLAAPALSRDDKTNIEAKLAAYQRDFSAWMQSASVLAERQATLSKGFGQLEPVINSLHSAIMRIEADTRESTVVARSRNIRDLAIALALITLGVMATSWMVGRSISRPITAMTRTMRSIAEGDFEAKVPSIGQRDEVGEMAAAVEVFKVNGLERQRLEAEQARERGTREKRAARVEALVQEFDRVTEGIIGTVSSAATELQAAANTLTATAEETSSQSTAVSAASEEASSNVQTVAAASEELATSVQEVTRQVEESARIASEAVGESKETVEKVRELSSGMQKIGEIVELIANVAGQTNLLALNATIEAARAGEAGRGFAVVAAEVEALADQTAKASAQIAEQITGIRTSTDTAVTAIGHAAGTVERMNAISGAIAAAVEEQATTTREIAQNIQQASTGTREVAGNITGVARAAEETSSAAAQVLGTSGELASQANLLKREVDSFLEGVRAA